MLIERLQSDVSITYVYLKRKKKNQKFPDIHSRNLVLSLYYLQIHSVTTTKITKDLLSVNMLGNYFQPLEGKIIRSGLAR